MLSTYPSGYGLVADRRSPSEVCNLAVNRSDVVAVKLHPKWVFDTGNFIESDALLTAKTKHGIISIVDSQLTTRSNDFEEWAKFYDRRIHSGNILTLSRIAHLAEIERVALLRDKYCPDTLLAVTAFLPEDTSELPEDMQDYMGTLCDNLRKVGNMGLYCAVQDLSGVDTTDILSIVAGISLDGQPYRDKIRGVGTIERAKEFNAQITLLGSILGPNPAAFLDEYAPI